MRPALSCALVLLPFYLLYFRSAITAGCWRGSSSRSPEQDSLYQLNDSDQMEDISHSMVIPAPRIGTDDDLDGGEGDRAGPPDL